MLREHQPARYASRREAITVVAYFREASPTNIALVLIHSGVGREPSGAWQCASEPDLSFSLIPE